MKFKFRLAYFLFGLMLGTFVVLFIFKSRGQDFCYLPNCRVLKDIRAKKLVFSDGAKSTFNEGWVNQTDVENTFTYGDVDFSKSKTPYKEGGKIYVVEGRNTKNEPITVEVVNGETKALVLSIRKQ